MQKLTAQRLIEALDRVLRAAVGGLQRDPAIGQRRAHLDDRAGVTGSHPLQRRHRAVDISEVADLGDPFVLLGSDLPERREHRRERHVDPHINGAECVLGGGRGGLHRIGIGDVGGEFERLSAGRPDVVGGSGESRLPRASSATFAPRAPNAFAVARPMPPLAPVTTTTWPRLAELTGCTSFGERSSMPPAMARPAAGPTRGRERARTPAAGCPEVAAAGRRTPR